MKVYACQLSTARSQGAGFNGISEDNSAQKRNWATDESEWMVPRAADGPWRCKSLEAN